MKMLKTKKQTDKKHTFDQIKCGNIRLALFSERSEQQIAINTYAHNENNTETPKQIQQ